MNTKAEGATRAQFGDLGSGGAAPGKEMNINLILDVAVTLSLEVGRARMSVRDLLQLAPGAIVELDRLAGEPLEMLCRGHVIARGEVMIQDEAFALRLTEIVQRGKAEELRQRRMRGRK